MQGRRSPSRQFSSSWLFLLFGNGLCPEQNKKVKMRSTVRWSQASGKVIGFDLSDSSAPRYPPNLLDQPDLRGWP
ncbi:hypothetical protein, partial [Methanothrix sp.]|uniref:hypothetical protein n=1 Tax=Methanothrix sp. TaxID=90426 RepID=UPI003BB6D1B7